MMNKQTAVSKNIYAIRTNFGLSQAKFGELVGVSQVTVSNWETDGHDVSEKNVDAIMAALPVSYDDIKSDRNGFAAKINTVISIDESSWVEVPLYGSIAAGTPIEMERAEKTFSIPSELKRRYPDAFLLEVKGESMNRKLPNGCYALIDPTTEVVGGKAYAVCVNGYDATIKRVSVLNNGFVLEPDSTDPTFKPKVYDYGEEGTETISVIGRVVWFTVPFDYEI